MIQTIASAESVEVPIAIALAEQLEGLHDLGSEIEEGGFSARVADRPIGYSVRSILRQLGKPEAEDTKIYKRFDIWVVPHRVAILRRSGFAEPTSVGIEVEYEHDSRTCSVVSLFPSFEYVEHGHVAGHLKFRGKMSATGEISPLSDAAASSFPSVSFGGMTASASAGGEIAIQCNSTVATPSISAVGVGASKCEWRINRRQEPLFGRDIETWSVLVLPKRQRELQYRMRFYFTTRTLFVPTRRQSDWVQLVCTLQN